jgi:hypothetical protein
MFSIEAQLSSSLDETRIKIVRWHSLSLLNVLKRGEHHIRTINPIPDDTKITRMGHDEVGNLYFVISSKEFDELKNGDIIPTHSVYFEKIIE